MLKKRGFIISEDEQKIVNNPVDSLESYNRFKMRYLPIDGKTFLQDNLSGIYKHSTNDPSRTTKVIFVREEDESKDQILTDTTNAIKILIDNNPDIKNIILIVRVKFRAANLNDLLSLVAYNIQIFLHSELFYNPLENESQPKFELLSIKDSSEYLGRNSDMKNIKTFCIDDPIIKFLGGTFNQVVKVHRTLSYIAQVEEEIEYKYITKVSIYEIMKKSTK